MSTAKEAERSILGALLLDGKNACPVAEDTVNAGDFWEPRNEVLYTRIMALYHEGVTPDLLLVMDALAKAGELSKVPVTYLHELVEGTPSAGSVGHYAKIVEQEAIRRRLTAIGQRLTSDASMAEVDPYGLVEQARAAIDAARQGDTGLTLEHLIDGLKETLADMDKPVRQVPTPWPSVNDVIGGMRPGQLIVVAARPSVGKSVMAQMLGMQLAKTGAVAYFSLEMPRAEIHKRIMSTASGVDLKRIMSGMTTDTDKVAITQSLAGLERSKIFVDDRAGVTITDIRRYVRTVSRSGFPLAGVVVDYLQLMSPPSGDKRSRQEFIADMSRQLKIMAKELGVPVIALSQLNRNSAASDDTKPRLSEMRESGAIEQDADVVMLMHRVLMSEENYKLALLVAKNRNGPTGTVDLEFKGYKVQITDPLGWE